MALGRLLFPLRQRSAEKIIGFSFLDLGDLGWVSLWRDVIEIGQTSGQHKLGLTDKMRTVR